MEVVDLFSGIGGFSKAAEAVGWRVAAHCEFADFPTKVLKKHWPGLPHFGDVRTLDATSLRSAGVDQVHVITGGFPCQDVSLAGGQKGLGQDDRPTRSGLFREIVRLAEEMEPRYVVMENMQGLLTNGLDFVAATFDALGWTLEWTVIPASAVGAPHQRNRVWMVAHRGRPVLPSAGAAWGAQRVGFGWAQPANLMGDMIAVEKFPWAGYVHEGSLFELPRPKTNHGGNLWPTCRASEHKDCGPIGSKSHVHMYGRDYLCAVVSHWENERTPQHQPTPKLNPDWVEPFMGYGCGWTDLTRPDADPFIGFPMGPGVDQYDWEAPRQTRQNVNRAPRIHALGNTIVPEVAELFLRMIMEGEAADVEAA